MTETKTEKRSLRYDFSASEVHDLSIQLAAKNKELVALEEEKNAVSSQYGARIKEVKANINKLSNQVSDGWELRDVECDVFYHKPEKGKKTTTRKDTGRSFVEPMESWEWNLFNQPGEEDEENFEEEDIEDADIVEDEGPKLLGN